MYDARPLDIIPGIFKEASGYAAQGRFVDGDNVRFWKGFAERIGGNSRVSTDHNFRPPRTSLAWRALDGTLLAAFAHARGVQILRGSSLTDVTPTTYSTLTLTVGAITGGPYTLGETVTAAGGGSGTVTAAAAATPVYIASDNGTMVLSLTSFVGSFYLGEAVTATGGGTARAVAGGSPGTFYIYGHTGTFSGTLTGSASGATATISSATDLWTGTLTGGTSGATSTLSAASETNPVNSGATVAWGESTWGSSVWGGTDSLYSSVTNAMTWTLATWGEDLVACPRGGAIYALDASTFIATPTTNLSAISGAPSNALGIFMNDANRTLVAYGAHDGSADDPLNIRWCDEEDYTTWTASSANTAGALRCEDGSLIIGRMQARDAHLISTDTAIYEFRYIGLPYVFSLRKIATGSTLLGANASAEQDGVTFWMGRDGFYYYDGTVNPLPCDVHQYVFGRLNAVQAFKVTCGSLRAYNEVWWFYASVDATEIDSYVCYNTVEKSWSIGSKSRTSWLDSNVVFSYPTTTKSDGSIHVDEYGTTDNGTAFDYALSTGDIEVDDGSVFLHTRKLIPNYDRIEGGHTVTIEARDWPARAATSKGPYAISSTTENISVRARGRTLRFVFEGSDDFRMGRWRYRITGHGRKP